MEPLEHTTVYITTKNTYSNKTLHVRIYYEPLNF